MRIILLFAILLLLSSCCEQSRGIPVVWTDHLEGDFSFAKEWSYPENVFKNDFGELVCDGLCDERLTGMRDKNGKIISDSITSYYQLLDTTHYYRSLQSDAQCYEWAGTDFAFAYWDGSDTLTCLTLCNAATHSSLRLKIINGKCFPQIKLNSITNVGTQHFDYKEGYIIIDKSLWEKEILKAEFRFDFINPDSTGMPLWWAGKIYAPIATRS